MFWFSSLLFIIQAINVSTNNNEWGDNLQDNQSKLSNLLDRDTSTRFSEREPWQTIYIPRPLLLNERIRNPKFISKNPKRNKTSQSQKPNTINKAKMVKIKKPGVSEPYANILNTNYKYVFLARMKNKERRMKKNESEVIQGKKNNSRAISIARPLDVRIGLERIRKSRVLRRRKKKE